MVCIFTTFFYIRYVFLQRFFTYGMYFYNVFCLRDNFEVPPLPKHICIFTYVFLHRFSPDDSLKINRVCISCAYDNG